MTIRSLLVQISLLATLTNATSLVYADKPVTQAFSGLKTHTIRKEAADSFPLSTQISYDPGISQLLNTRLDLEFNSQGIGGIEMMRVLLTKIDRTKKDRYYIDFDPGASNDPVFAIFPEGGKSVIGTIDADHLVLPGNGFIYAFARTNKTFLERRKYLIQGDQLVESKQAFLYVGLDTKAKANFSLLSSKNAGELVASVRKGDKVFVVLNDGDYYLIRTAFGLLGWLRLESIGQASSVIEGIYFAGD